MCPVHVNYMLAVIVITITIAVITIIVSSKDKGVGQLVAIGVTESFNLLKSLITALPCSPISQLMSDPTRLSITPFSSIRWPILSFGLLESSTLFPRTHGVAFCAEWFPRIHPDPPSTSSTLLSALGGWVVWTTSVVVNPCPLAHSWVQPIEDTCRRIGRRRKEAEVLISSAPSLPRYSMLVAFLHYRPQLLPGSPVPHLQLLSLDSGNWVLFFFIPIHCLKLSPWCLSGLPPLLQCHPANW